MKILSFDVGIINLAYCIFDTTKCKILNWEVINLENNNMYLERPLKTCLRDGRPFEGF